MIKSNYLHTVAQLRTTVAYLGEHCRPMWWPSGFFAPTSHAFLLPVFSRTTFLSQYHGARQAANMVHDEFIGVGGQVYHLFRLPETMEQALHEYLSTVKHSERIQDCIASFDKAMHTLLEISGESTAFQPQSGPVRVGSSDVLQQRKLWQKVARYYYAAFVQGTKTYPYITNQ